MKKYFVTLALLAALAAASYAITRSLLATPQPEEDHRTWLQGEFKLTAPQLAAVEKLQAGYDPVCAGHCALVRAARERLAASPHDPALNAELARLKKICFEATSAHLRQIAAEMDPEQGRRFLALMEPKVSGHDHAEPLGLQ